MCPVHLQSGYFIRGYTGISGIGRRLLFTMGNGAATPGVADGNRLYLQGTPRQKRYIKHYGARQIDEVLSRCKRLWSAIVTPY